MNSLYDVKNDSSEDEEDKEDFILDGSSQDGDSPRRIVSVTENYSNSEKPYKLNTDRKSSYNNNFQVSSTPVKSRGTPQQVSQKAPITELKDTITKCAFITNIRKCIITTDGILTQSDIKTYIRNRCDVYVKEIHYQPPNTECIANFGNVENASGFLESISVDCTELGGFVRVEKCTTDHKDKWNKTVASWNRLNGLPVSDKPILEKSFRKFNFLIFCFQFIHIFT